MITLKTDPQSPSSNIETGVRSNFWNKSWKFITVLIFLLTGAYAAFTGFASLGFWISISIWYGASFLIFLSVALNIGHYGKKVLHGMGDENVGSAVPVANWGDGSSSDNGGDCLANLGVLLVFPVGIPLTFALRKSFKELRNRFVWHKGKGFVFLGDEDDPLEIESANPFFWLWLMLFRKADQYDMQARIIDKDLEEYTKKHQELVLPKLDSATINGLQKNVDDFLDIEFNDPRDSFYKDEDKFIEYLKDQMGNKFNGGMELYARSQHKQKVLAIIPR